MSDDKREMAELRAAIAKMTKSHRHSIAILTQTISEANADHAQRLDQVLSVATEARDKVVETSDDIEALKRDVVELNHGGEVALRAEAEAMPEISEKS